MFRAMQGGRLSGRRLFTVFYSNFVGLFDAGGQSHNTVYALHRFLRSVSSTRGFLSMKWFTKGEIFTTRFDFDLNRSTSEKKMCSKMSMFKPCQKTFPPLVNGNEQKEKLITFLLRGKIIFCYRVNRFLTVSLLSEILT